MIIVISKEHYDHSEPKIWLQLLENGLENLHIRKYDLTDMEVIQLINSIPMTFRKALVLHSHHHLANELGINRLHFNSHLRDNVSKNGFKKYQLSCSVHHISEFNSLGSYWEYALLSPVYPSLSKPGYGLNKSVISQLVDRKNRQVSLVALSGINKENIDNTLQMGFDAVALMGSIWNSENPLETFHACRLKTLNHV